MSERVMPPDLVATLRRAISMEAFADTGPRYRNAVNAAGVLLLAAFDASWQLVELAAVVELKKATVQKRIKVARLRLGGQRPSLIIQPPPNPQKRHKLKPTDVLKLRLEDREWLTSTEALQFIGRDGSTLTNWTRAGLLPITIVVSSVRLLFLRADLKRVMASHRPKGYADYKALRAAIAASGL